MPTERRNFSSTISYIWDMNALDAPDEVAIEDEVTTLTRAEAKLWTDRVALGLLEAGIKRNEVVVIQLPNCVELHLLRVACEKAGILCVPVLSNMRERELGYILSYTNAAAAVIPREYRGFDYVSMIDKLRQELPSLRRVLIADGETKDEDSLSKLCEMPMETRYAPDYLDKIRFTAEEVSMICLTSGTTGVPKLVKYRSDATGVADDLIGVLKLTSADIVAALAPAARGPNVTTYLAAPRARSRIVMLPWFGAGEAISQIARKKPTVVCMVPAQLSMIISQATLQSHNLSSVRIWLCAGSLVPPSLVEAVENKIGGVVLSQYGAVDFGVMTLALPEDSQLIRSTTVGKPRFQNGIRLVDDNGREVTPGLVGEVTSRGLHSSLGYYLDEKATEEVWKDGWYSAGDLGRFDESGNLMIVGRKKDVIIRGGQNIYPAEIEELLLTHPMVRKVALVAMPDQVMGEKACAFVVADRESPLKMEEMISFLKDKGVAPFKIPERLELVDSLPMVADGQKIDKKALAEELANKLKREISDRTTG